jgi:hypothetical protein
MTGQVTQHMSDESADRLLRRRALVLCGRGLGRAATCGVLEGARGASCRRRLADPTFLACRPYRAGAPQRGSSVYRNHRNQAVMRCHRKAVERANIKTTASVRS